MTLIRPLAFKSRTLFRLMLLIGMRQLRMTWNGHTVSESFQGQATPLEAAAFLTLQNIPRLKNRKRVDAKLRRYIKQGAIRRGVLANGYPEIAPQQSSLFEGEATQPAAQQATAQDLVSLIEEVNSAESQLLNQYSEYDTDDDEYEYDDRPLFLYGLLTGTLLTALVPLWMWLAPTLSEGGFTAKVKYSPQVIKVAAARGQDCARSIDLYSQLYCGELWRKELSARVEQNYIDLLAVSSAIDSMHRQSGFEVAQPLAARIQRTQTTWQQHLEQVCNTAAAIENLGAKRSNLYLECIHEKLLAREAETRGQLNYLRSLGWQEQADDVLTNELIAIRNMAASKAKTEASDTSPETQAETETAADDAVAEPVESTINTPATAPQTE